MIKQILTGSLMILLAGSVGCATLGRPIPSNAADQIIIGKTTRAEIENKLGAPERVGIDSGDTTATYMYYHFGLFDQPITTDLKITFSKDGLVKAYTYDSNQGDEE